MLIRALLAISGTTAVLAVALTVYSLHRGPSYQCTTDYECEAMERNGFPVTLTSPYVTR